MESFYILGDMGSGNKDQISVASAMKEHIHNNSNNTYVCGLGDNIYEKGCSSLDDIQFITKFEDPYSDISNKIKFYMLLGNHDYGGSYNVQTGLIDYCPDIQVEYGIISQKKGMKWYMPDKYYTFSKGSVDFFVLDTNLDMYSDNGEEQLNYFIKKIKKSKKKWKIVMGHHTWRSVGGHGNAEQAFESFMRRLLEKCSFDIYFCGHDHNKQVINLNMFNKDVCLIVCGTGGKVYHDYTDYSNIIEDSDFVFRSNNLGYGFCKLINGIMNITFYDDKNNIEYIHKISKL